MASDELKEMDLRLERIERAIERIARPGGGQVEIAEADIEAYHRVRAVLWEEGTCGINETSPCVITCRIIERICKVVPIPLPKPCDVECTCGPCTIFTEFGALRGGMSRFRALGY